MNISILVILKDFILFCDEHGITEPTKKDIRDYVASMHFDFMNESEADFDVEYFEKDVEKALENVFKNIVGIPRKEKTERKRMIKHEMIAIIKPENSENALDTVIDIIKKQSAKITKAETWGEKKLAYPIRKNGAMYEKGFYIQLYFKVEAVNNCMSSVYEAIANIEEELNKNQNIIKHIIVKEP